MTSDKDEAEETIAEFKDAVNMAPNPLKEWLSRDESRAVGPKSEDDSESTGHASGRRIVAILRKRQAEYTDGDLAHMRKVTVYAHRHLAQPPDGDIAGTVWRHSPMNWGHDPAKSD